jgi:hypothetical protein
MKKIMFTLALVSLVFTSAQAQKQLGGEHNIEVNLTPLGESPINGTTLKYRNFIDDDKAFRLTFTLNSSSDKAVLWQDGEASTQIGNLDALVSPELFVASSTTVFGLALGYEKHFSGTDNLSPYIGFEGFFQLNSRNDLTEAWGPGELEHVGDFDQFVVWEMANSQTSTSYGINLLFGADYYFNDAIYVGFEAGLGFGISKYGNHLISTNNGEAFNLHYYQASDPNEIGAATADSFNGQLNFNVMDSEQHMGFSNYGVSSVGGLYVDYEDEDLFPNGLSNTTIGNVFNAALRVGFLFD